LSPAIIIAAESRALALGVGADEVLIASGHVSEEAYYKALAFSLGCPFVDLDTVPREWCPLASERLVLAATSGILPLAGREAVLVMAPRGLAVRTLILRLGARSDLRHRALVTSPEQIRRFVQRHAAGAISWRASEWLRSTHPALSAATPPWKARTVLAALTGAFAVGLAAAPEFAVGLLMLAVTGMFLAWSALRICSMLRKPGPPALAMRSPEGELPTYTIVVALYREATTLYDLVGALQAIDYPPEKLDIKLVLEADDRATRLAADLMELQRPFEIVLVAPSGPRTKPKALNTALPFARGEFVVIYDAEDHPEPDQLRRALAAFRAGGQRLACVQARLTIDNTDDSALTRVFTAEYAGLFDALLPGLAALRLPIPLGGSSNHFRTHVLRALGGWDPYNVAEDADLGMRLARLGYGADVIASSTFEEAPAQLKPWLRQRTRWFKGWMQTWCVHMRRPGLLISQLGFFGCVAFQLILIGTVFAALLQPFALVVLPLLLAFRPSLFADVCTFGIPGLGWLHLIAFVGGYVTSVVLALVGLRRRGLLSSAWLRPAMLLHWTLLHWMLLSLAAWRALFHFLFDPYRWEKTEHGLARTSRRATQQSEVHK
jgi:cellulose synthase/poly-beta-1,6-N-acetylglucosamine synthase-like glycosyltransferase